MAIADSARNNKVLEESESGLLHFPVKYTNGASTAKIMTVRISVARSESTPRIPILAKIAVSAAKHAESSAHNSQPDGSVIALAPKS